MFYKASDPNTSTSDWLSLNTSAIPQALLTRMGDDGLELTEIVPNNRGLEIPQWHVQPCDDDPEHDIELFYEPEQDDYDGQLNEYKADLAAWKAYDKEAREIIRSIEAGEIDMLPMWGTMWVVEDHPKLREAASRVGLRCYEHPEVRGLILGADSAGHSFFEAYWIPLRADIVASNEYFTDENRRALYDTLATEYKREGGKPATIAKILGIEV